MQYAIKSGNTTVLHNVNIENIAHYFKQSSYKTISSIIKMEVLELEMWSQWENISNMHLDLIPSTTKPNQMHTHTPTWIQFWRKGIELGTMALLLALGRQSQAGFWDQG